jgi:hypothetical protein
VNQAVPRVSFGPISLPRSGVRIALGQPNPGIGGTEFVTTQTALRLAQSFSNVELSVIGHGIELDGEIETRWQANITDYSAIGCDIVVMPSWYAQQLSPDQIGDARLIVTSHHPHDGWLRGIVRKLPVSLVLSVGAYTYRSNRWLGVPHAYHRNPVVPHRSCVTLSPERVRSDEPIVGHLSSLHPAKGFLRVAKAWPEILRRFPGARLEVVGGIGMYGELDIHPEFPTQPQYGEKIAQVLVDKKVKSSVRFYGIISEGLDEIVSKWDLAILNPTGLTEADPASFKDCFRVGVPVLAGFDYGAVDYLASFPELQIHNPRNLSQQAIGLLSDAFLLDALRGKVINEWDRIVERDEIFRLRFAGLVTAVLADDARMLHALVAAVSVPRMPWGIRRSLVVRSVRQRCDA